MKFFKRSMILLVATICIILTYHTNTIAIETDNFSISENQVTQEGAERNIEVNLATSSSFLFTPDITGYYRLRTLSPAENFSPQPAAMAVTDPAASAPDDPRKGTLVAEGPNATAVYMVEGIEYVLSFTTSTIATYAPSGYIGKVALEEAVELENVVMSKRTYDEIITLDLDYHMTVTRIGQDDSFYYNHNFGYDGSNLNDGNDPCWQLASMITIGEGFSDIEIGYFYNLIVINFPKTTNSVRGLQNITSLLEANLPQEAVINDVNTNLFAGTLVRLNKIEEIKMWNNNAMFYEPIVGKTSTFIPVGTDYVAAELLKNQTQLEEIYFCEGLRNIGRGAMAGCTSLKQVLLPSAVQVIQEEAFRGDSSLSSFAIVADQTSGLKTIGERAFLDCPKLTNIYLPSNVERIDEHALGYVTNAAGKEVVDIDPATGLSRLVIKCWQNSVAHHYAVNNGIRYEVIGWKYQPGLVPTINMLGAIEKKGGAYYKITSITPPLTVSYLKPTSKKAQSVSVPASITVDGISFAVTCVDEYAFMDCKKLQKVVLPNSLTQIKTGAFLDCAKLKKIQVNSTKITNVGKNAFKGIDKKAIIKVPNGTTKSYKNKFKNKGQSKKVKVK